MKHYLSRIAAVLTSLFIVTITVWNLKNQTWKSEDTPYLNGAKARAFESQFESSLVISDWAKGLWAAIDYTLFKEGYDGVVVGRDGWLFSAEEFFVPPKTQSKLEENVLFVSRVQQALAAFDIALKIALIPEKAELYAEFAPDRARQRLMLRQDVRSQLVAGGTQVVDLFDALNRSKNDQPLFLKTDTHWTPLGAKIAAREIAKYLPRYESTAFTTQETEISAFRGDLLNFIPVAPHFSQFGPSPDMLTTHATERLLSGDEDMLFAPVSDPAIALVGTSYSANPNWNFPGFLREQSQQEILDLSTEGKGPFTPMHDFLSDWDLSTTNIKTVIWEIPVRYFESNEFSATNRGTGS